MDYIFLDMEWNQPRGRANTVTEPVLLHGEIIRIGAVKVDENMKETARIHYCVIPKFYKKMNYSVGKLTGLGTNAMTYGQKFPAAYRRFMEWCGEDCVFITWGSEDERVLDVNLAVHGMNPEHPKFYDLQQIFAHRIMQDSRQYSLQAAVEHYELDCGLKAHDALNDAVYCSMVGIEMGFAEHLEGYDRMLTEAAELRSEKYIRTFMNIKSREDALRNRRITMCCCPRCRRIMKRTSWKMYNEHSAAACCTCKEHGEYYAKLKMKRCSDGTYAVTRRFTRMTPGCKDFYNKASDRRIPEKV